MQGRFKMEYRLFTIVRYNYKDYNTACCASMAVNTSFFSSGATTSKI